MKKAAVISLTERGRALSAYIKKVLDSYKITRFCFHRHTDEDAVSFDDMAALTGEIFKEYDASCTDHVADPALFTWLIIH